MTTAATASFPYDAFLEAADAELALSTTAIAIIRMPATGAAEALRLLRSTVRTRDTVAPCGGVHVLLLLPNLTASVARKRLEMIIAGLRAFDLHGLYAGVADGHAGVDTATRVIREAGKALADARDGDVTTATWNADRATL